MERTDYLILTPSYDRPLYLERQLGQLCEESIRMEWSVIHIVLDDCSKSKKEYADIIQKWHGTTPYYDLRYSTTPRHHGKEGFWKTYNMLLAQANIINFKFCIGLADDLELCRDFLRRTTRHFRFLQEQSKQVACLNIFSRFPTNWGTTQYEDGAFICTRNFFDKLTWQIEPIPKSRFDGHKKRRYRSSGVHQQITYRIGNKRGVEIAPVPGISYVRPYKTMSVMHPEPDRIPKPWECNFVDE